MVPSGIVTTTETHYSEFSDDAATYTWNETSKQYESYWDEANQYFHFGVYTKAEAEAEVANSPAFFHGTENSINIY